MVTESDQALLKKLAPTFGNGASAKTFPIPSPALCPSCRRQRRMAFRNESTLYQRPCDFNGQITFSIYRPDAPFPVYSPEAWFSDAWDARDYGQDFDFKRPFFDQFVELRNRVPHLALVSYNNENCPYCHLVGNSRNCTMLYGSIHCEDCYYGNPFYSKNCVDTLGVRHSELCLECVDSTRLYDCAYCQNCDDSQSLRFCYDVKASANCFGCAGLVRKEFHLFNKPYPKEEYERLVKRIDLNDKATLSKVWKDFSSLKASLPRRFITGQQNENVTGNTISESKDCFDCFNAEKCRDVSHAYQVIEVNDAMDVAYGEQGELLYEFMGFYNRISRMAFCYLCWDGTHDLLYSALCTQGTHNCFGSVGLKRAEYCILNKQYTKEEYEKIVPRIIEHMKSTGEFGEFFPMSAAPHAYNETVAQEFHPLTREKIEQRGLVESKDESIHVCEVTGQPFRILVQEKRMRERFGFLLPTRSPHQRHLDRIKLRNPLELWERPCNLCGVMLQTSYAPNRPEPILCDACYLKQKY